MTERLVTARDVADHLGFSLNTVYALAQKGEIPVAVKVGSKIRFRLSEVEQALSPAAQS